MRPLYGILKSQYRRTLQDARQRYLEKQEELLLLQTAKEPHKWLRRTKPPACPINATVLTDHFRGMYAAADTVPRSVPTFVSVWDELTSARRRALMADFDVLEVLHTMERLQSNKASGSDGIRNEHLRSATVQAPCWTALFNACLRNGRLPRNWNDALLCVIPKGKGDPTLPSSWRAIAKKSCCYKLLALLISRRLTRYLEACDCIPDQQHGFRTGRSTITAVDLLLREVHSVLPSRNGTLRSICGL